MCVRAVGSIRAVIEVDGVVARIETQACGLCPDLFANVLQLIELFHNGSNEDAPEEELKV